MILLDSFALEIFSWNVRNVNKFTFMTEHFDRKISNPYFLQIFTNFRMLQARNFQYYRTWLSVRGVLLKTRPWLNSCAAYDRVAVLLFEVNVTNWPHFGWNVGTLVCNWLSKTLLFAILLDLSFHWLFCRFHIYCYSVFQLIWKNVNKIQFSLE